MRPLAFCCIPAVVAAASCAETAARDRTRAAAPLLSPAPGAPVPVAARAMAAGDFNGDRRADLVLCVEKNLMVYFGTAERAWRKEPGVTTEMPEKMSDIAVADLDHDGKQDLVLVDHDSYAVAIMLGAGDGRFKPSPGSPFAAREGEHPHTHGLVVVDMNRDGRLDVVTANNSDGDLSVLLGDGKGKFTRAAGSPFRCGPSPYPIATADINGDGHADVLVPNSTPNVRTLNILLGNGRGQLAQAPNSPLAVGATLRWAACGDINGDKLPDVVASHDDSPDVGRSLTILMNQGQGKLTPAASSPLPIGHFAWSVEVVDMDRDGKADLVVGADTGIRLFLGDGRGGFRAAPGSPYKTGKGAWRATVADFNGDGKLDVASRSVEANQLEILLGN
jgi:hypothetical protein